MSAIPPNSESHRLEVLRAYDIWESGQEEEYDDLARLAVHICGATAAVISLSGEDRQWFKSRINFPLTGCSHDDSICSKAIQGRDLCIIPNLQNDPRFFDNCFVSGEPHLRFYAGVPLVSPEGCILGAICVLDFVPRTLTKEQEQSLLVLSRMVMTKLDLRRKSSELLQAGTTQEMIVKALHDSEQRARLLSEAFSPIHWSMNADLTDFQPSERWLEFTGITAEELERDGWLATIHPDERERCLAEIAVANFQGKAHEAEVRLLYKDGTWRWMLVRAVPLKGPDGGVLRWLGTNVDINDRYVTEEALRVSEERLRLALEAGELGTWDTDLNVGCIYWDKRGQQQFGMSVLKTSRVEARQKIHEDDRPQVSDLIDNAMKSEDGMFHAEHRVVWPDGSLHWLACSGKVHFFGEGAARKPVRITGVNRDITEERKSQTALETKSKLLAAVSESLEVFLAQGDWSKALARLLRCAREQTASNYGFIGVLANEGLELRILSPDCMTDHPEDSETFKERVAQNFHEKGYFAFSDFQNLFGTVILTGKVAISNVTCTDALPRNGLPLGHPPLQTFIGVPILQGEEVVGMIALANRPEGYSPAEQSAMEMLVQQAGVLCNSYRQNERGTALQRERESLENQLRHSQKMEAVGQLAGGVAHDFNNLLTVITGHAEMSLMQLPNSGPQRDSLLQIAMAGERAAQLTRQLLTFSRRQFYQPASVEINQVIREIASMLQRMVGEKVTIETRLASSLPPILADARMLEQVLMNFVVNARDALPDGGPITIKTGSRQIDEVHCRQKIGAKPGRTVWLSVSDGGCGIEPEHLARIFEPFYTTKDIGAGTGLGLATVYGIVQQHGGWIEVESTPGKGTTFTVFIPATAEAVIEEEPPVNAGIRGGNEMILLVEDEEFVRMLAKSVLEDLGYRVLEAANGAEALEMWARNHNKIGLLLTDMVMPGKLSGRDVAEHFLLSRPALPVIYTSGYSPELFKKGVELRDGINFLAKPYRPQELTEAIREALDRN